MTEKTSILGGMLLGHRCFTVGIVALFAKNLSRFSLHSLEFVVNLVLWESGRGLFRGVEKKKKKSATDYNKNNIIYQCFVLVVFHELPVRPERESLRRVLYKFVKLLESSMSVQHFAVLEPDFLFNCKLTAFTTRWFSASP